MAFSIGFIITFFNNKFSVKILRNVFYFIITYSIDVFCIRIYFSCLLHNIKLFFVIKCPVIIPINLSSFILFLPPSFKFYIINIIYTQKIPCIASDILINSDIGMLSIILYPRTDKSNNAIFSH